MSLRLDGWSPKLNVGYDSVRGAIGGIVLVWLGMFVALVFFDRENIYAKSILALPAPYQYHAVFSLVIWSPLLEEILARGYFFELLHKEGNPFFALVLSTALFVVPHGIWGEWGAGLVLITFSSIVCTFAYTQGGIWAAAVTHVFANGFILFLNWQI
jgi:membrane protease YdiL (CAAX protease family)